MARVTALLSVLFFALLGFESVHGEAQTGSCRLVCDPAQSQSGTYDIGVNGLVIPLSSSGSGAPGPMGPPGKAGPPGPQGPKGEDSLTRGAVAFYAALKEDFSKDDVLKFTNVVTNLGGRYDSSTGIFTCRSAGVYHFSYHILKTGVSLRAELVHNDKVVASAVAVDALHTDTASNSAVLQLSSGDRVFVRLSKSDSTLKDSTNLFSTFSGHLLYEL